MKVQVKPLNNDYSSLELDALKEIINIGGGNAATSLSQLINETIDMTVPVIQIMEYDEVFTTIMPEETLIHAVLIKTLGTAEGVFLFVARPEESDKLVNMMAQGIRIDQPFSDSALKELVNVLVNSFLNAVTQMIDVMLSSSVPLLTKDMFGAIVSSVYLEQEQYDPNVLILKNEFHYLGERMEASLYFVPKPGVLEKLFTILGV